MTMPERVLWNRLRRNRAGLKFRRQHPVGPNILDFFCHAAALAIELDGESHYRPGSNDAARDAWLRTQGLDVLRISVSGFERNRDGTIETIIATCQARAAERSRSCEHETEKSR